MSRPATATIDLSALRHNYQLACSLAPQSKTLAVVKANAYGHDAVECAKALESAVPVFAVACIEEALELRAAGIKKPILLLEGQFSADELNLVEQHNFWLVLSNQHQVDMIVNTSPKTPYTVWIKVDTGMHRLGFPANRFAEVYAQLNDLPQVASDIVVASHFAAADDIDNGFTVNQIANFKSLLPQPLPPTSLANSAGILAWPESHGSWNRPGFMLYGASPLTQPHTNAQTLKPVMTLTSNVIDLHSIAAGEVVGYGCRWQAQRPSLIATVAIGYGDGYPRQAPNGTPVLVKGQLAPLAGRVSMDMITVDVTDLDDIAIGDSVELWGNQIDVNHIAHLCHTIGYELLTRMTMRVHKRFI